MTSRGKLFLLPNHLDLTSESLDVLPRQLEKVVPFLDGLFVESEKGARRFLKCFRFEEPKTFRDVKLRLLNEHTHSSEIEEMVEVLASGEKWGVLSDAGMPCLADPGSNLVKAATKKMIPIEIFQGRSSIVHALMMSGFNTQSFSFHGYLPRTEKELFSTLKFLNTIAFKSKQTQIFIETPYRNQKLFDAMLKILHPNTQVFVALNLMTKEEKIINDKVATLKKTKPYLSKDPAVFLIV
jgi:16S rRNA (cytidine1402-2'-O)-methyltransferase